MYTILLYHATKLVCVRPLSPIGRPLDWKSKSRWFDPRAEPKFLRHVKIDFGHFVSRPFI